MVLRALLTKIRPNITSLFMAMLLFVCFSMINVVVAEDDATIVRLLEEGTQALLKGDTDTAFNSFQNILVLQPQHPEAHFRLSQVFINKRDLSKAAIYLKQATKLDPFNARYSLNLGEFFEKTNQREKALEEYQRLMDTGSRDPLAKEAEKRLSLATGQALAKKGEMNAALLIFNGLVLDYPDDPAVLANIGATYVFLNRVGEAEQIFLRLLALEPKNTIAHLNLANIFERTNRPEAAMRHFKTLIDLGGDPKMVKEARIRYGVINGREYLRRRDWPNAVKVFQEVINLDPKRTEAFFNIALANLNLGNIEMAEKGFLGVLKVDPNDFSARLNLGSLYTDTGRLEKAKEQFRFIAKNDRGRYGQEAKARMNKIHTMLADKALQEGKVEESLREYENALDFYSGNVKASFNRGLIYIKKRQFEKARVEFESVVRNDPQNARGRMNLANVYEQIGQMSKAAEQYEIVMQIDRTSREGQIASAKWRITKARGLWAEKKLAAAEKIFEEIVEDQPQNIEALFYLGTIQQSKGLLEEAAGAFQRILDIKPGNQRVRVQLAKIYEQLGLDQLAANEYQFIMFNGAAQAVVSEANLRLTNVEKRLSGFFNTMSYEMSYDSNANLNQINPLPEFRSQIAFNVLYSQTLLNDLKYNLSVSPSYSNLFEAEADYFNNTLNAGFTKGSPRQSFSVQYAQQTQSALAADEDVSSSSTINVSVNRTMFLPAIFDLTPAGFEGEKISTGFSINGSLRNIQSFGTPTINSFMGTLGFNFNQSLAMGIRANIGYQLIVTRYPDNVFMIQENRQLQERNGETVVGIGDGTLITYDSRDYEHIGNSVSLSLSRILSPGVAGTILGSVQYLGYSNKDSSFLDEKQNADSIEENIDKFAYKAGAKNRQNMNLLLNGNLTYNFFKDISFYFNVTMQANFSSLGAGLGTQSTEAAVASFQSTSLGRLYRFSASSGFRMSF